MLIADLDCNGDTGVIGIASSRSALRFSNLSFLLGSIFRLIIKWRQVFAMLYNQRTLMVWSKFLRINIIILLVVLNDLLILVLLLTCWLLLLSVVVIISSIITVRIFLLLNIHVIFWWSSLLLGLDHQVALRSQIGVH